MMLRKTGIGQTNNNGLGGVLIDPKNDAFLWLEENLRLVRERGGLDKAWDDVLSPEGKHKKDT